METIEKIRESNRIEGIIRSPTRAEIDTHEWFVTLDVVTIEALEKFVSVYQPNARLRDEPGLNVRVGNYFPPAGGVDIALRLDDIINDVNRDIPSHAWKIHVRYEQLHPFTDGNGRSGRALWYWMMRYHPMGNLGFLHAFYYQTLEHGEQK